MELTLWYLSGVWNLEVALLDFWKKQLWAPPIVHTLSFWSCDSCRHLLEPKRHSFLFNHWSSSKCLVVMAARTPSIHVFLGRPYSVCIKQNTKINTTSIEVTMGCDYDPHPSTVHLAFCFLVGYIFTECLVLVCLILLTWCMWQFNIIYTPWHHFKLNRFLHYFLWPVGDFVLVHASYQSHLGSDCLFAPNAKLADGIIWLLVVRAGISRGQLLQVSCLYVYEYVEFWLCLDIKWHSNTTVY